jgi:hypothetical protein
LGQKAKFSRRAYVFRFTPGTGHHPVGKSPDDIRAAVGVEFPKLICIFGTTYRLSKQVRLALADSEYCARKTASQNQEHRVAKKAKKRTVRPYSKTEEKELRAHSKAKTPVAKISKLTKRSVAALRKKAMVMGLPLGHRR